MKFPFLIGIFFLSVLVAGGMFFFLTSSPQAVQVLDVDKGCDLHSSDCLARDNTDVKTVTLAFLPRQIPLMKELTVQSKLQGFGKISKAQVVVEGINMFMGYQFTPLEQDASGSWSGKLVLPVCTLETMQWQARIEINSESGAYQASFPFSTSRQ